MVSRARSTLLDRATRFAAEVVEREGSALLRGLHPRPASAKGEPDDPVTTEDRAVEERILGALAGRFPGHDLLGEETGYRASGSPFVWVVDPIDGTTNFAKGLPLFCVAIALLEEGRPVAAAVFSALEREVYFASAGGGAFAGGRRLRVQRGGDGPLALLAVQPRRGLRPYHPALLRRFGKLRRLGSAVAHLVGVARGAFYACLDERCRLWDLAAGVLLVREAGGRVVGFDGAEIERFVAVSGPDFPAIPAIAGGDEAVDTLLRIVRDGRGRSVRGGDSARCPAPP